MTSTTFFIIFIPILSILLLAINLLLAPHNPYQEKDSAFECGFHSFLGQNRTQFSVSFFIFALLFLLFDLEILLVYPYSVSSYTNDIYGLVIMMVFFVLLTLGFIFELGKNALSIESRQTVSYNNEDTNTSYAFFKNSILVLKSGFGFDGDGDPKVDGDDGKHDPDTTYVKVVKDGKNFFVPIVAEDAVTPKIDLSKPIYEAIAKPNNEKISNLALVMYKEAVRETQICNCDMKTSGL